MFDDGTLRRLWPHGDSKISGLIAGIVLSAPAVFPKYGITTPLVVIAGSQPSTVNRASAPHLKWSMIAGTTISTTFKIRAGGTGSTVTFNGVAAARKFGGTYSSYLSVREIMS